MGATRDPRDRASFVTETADRQLPPPALVPSPDELTLPLDREELRMLEIFHKSFNLPGLRFGLVRPVADEDYYPPDDEEFEPDDDEDAPPPQQQRQRGSPAAGSGGSSRAAARVARPARPAYEEPDAATELQQMLERTRAMRLGVDAVLDGAPEIDDEAIGEELGGGGAAEDVSDAVRAHQRQVLRPGSRPTSSSGAGSKPPSANGRARPRRW